MDLMDRIELGTLLGADLFTTPASMTALALVLIAVLRAALGPQDRDSKRFSAVLVAVAALTLVIWN